MPVQALTKIDPQQFFNLSSATGAGTQQLNTKVSGVAVSNDFTGRLSVTTAEGDTITLSADLESDFRAVNYKSHVEGDGKTVDAQAKYAEFSLKQEFGVTVQGDLNEQEVKDLESTMTRSKGRMHEIKNNREYQAMLKEIEDLKTDIRAKEDQILEQMETIERLDKQVKSADKDLERHRQQLEADKEETRKQSEMIAARLETLETLQSEVRRKMEPDIIKRYDFLVEKRNGSAVAAVQESACQLCHLSLPPQKYVELQRDEAIMNCPSCLRFIYWAGNDAYQVLPEDFEIG